MATDVNLKSLAFGVASYVPGVTRIFRRANGGASSARYCYGVWLRHLVSAADSGMREVPRIVAELGPGDSLGTGMAALLSGAEKYYAFDVIQYASNAENLAIFEELVALFTARAAIPDAVEFPLMRPTLASYEFPHALLSEATLASALAPDRLRRIREAITAKASPDGMITYVAPWLDDRGVRPGAVDMIISQAVLEHVDELEQAYGVMHRWLKPSGYMTHAIDFKSHSMTGQWNGHWGLEDLTWKLLRGKRPYMLNRQPHSAHQALMRRHGFRVLVDQPYSQPSAMTKSALSRSFRDMSDTDFATSEAFMVAVPDAAARG